MRQVLDDELLHLPEKYRAPVVLCDLEGRTHQEAAVELGCPSGSMSRRLEQARALLRHRLVHRGVTLALGLAGVGLAAYLAGRATHHEIHHAEAVRRVMTSLKPLAHGGPGVDNRPHRDHSRICRPLTRPRSWSWPVTPPMLLPSSKHTTPARIETPGAGLPTEMHSSAMQLAQATQGHSQLAMLSAARRLDASCVRCHEVFSD